MELLVPLVLLDVELPATLLISLMLQTSELEPVTVALIVSLVLRTMELPVELIVSLVLLTVELMPLPV